MCLISGRYAFVSLRLVLVYIFFCFKFCLFFFFKQKTAYEMRISDWSSDVCSSDLPSLAQTLERAPYAALHSRIQVQVKLKPVVERERFAAFIQHGLKAAGCPHTLLADSGIELLRQASKGLPRQAGLILCTAMRLAVPQGLNHLPDALLAQERKSTRLNSSH